MNAGCSSPADHLHDPGVLVSGALQGFPPGGHVVEEVLHLQKITSVFSASVLFMFGCFPPGTDHDLGPLVPSTRFGGASGFSISVAGSVQSRSNRLQ